MEYSNQEQTESIYTMSLSKTSWTQDNTRSYEDLLVPFQKSMRIFGLLASQETKTFLKVSPGKIYQYSLLVIFWINILRYFAAYEFQEKFEMPFIGKIINHIIYLWGGAGILGGYRISKEQIVIFNLWRMYLQEYYSPRDKMYIKMQIHRVRVAHGLCWSMIAIFFGYSLLDIFINGVTSGFGRIQLIPFINPCEDISWIGFAVIVILQVYMGAMPTFTLGYLLLLVLGIRDEFTVFNHEFNAKLHKSKHGMTFSGDLEMWRLRHKKIATIVKHIDLAFSLFILLAFVSIIPMCCVLVYAIIMVRYPITVAIFMWILMLPTFAISIGILFVITYCGTKLNTQASVCKANLYNMYLGGSEWTAQKRFQYQIFYSKLSEMNIGISGWNLFFIDKLTLKMVILLIVSYTVILLKFGKGIREGVIVCDNMNVTSFDM